MSEQQEQQTTPQVEAVKPEATVEQPSAADKVADESSEQQQPVEGSGPSDEQAQPEEPTNEAVPVPEDKKSDETDKVNDETSKEESVEQPSEGKALDEEKVAEEKTDTDDKTLPEKVAEVNGDNSESVPENGHAIKRKVENGAEAVEEEKSPKKAKVVDEGDQAPVEETAA